MEARMEWPHIYRVTMRGIEGQTDVRDALSFLGPYKAVAMAVEVHGYRWFPRRGWPVYSVEVEDIGPAPSDDHGLVDCPKGCMDDRDEF